MNEDGREIEKENKAEQSFIFYKKKRKNNRKTNGKGTKRKAQDQNDWKDIEGKKRETDRRQEKKNTGKQWTLDCGLWTGWIIKSRQVKKEDKKHKEEKVQLRQNKPREDNTNEDSGGEEDTGNKNKIEDRKYKE